TRHGDHADADRKGRPRPRRHPGRLLPERPNRVCRPASSRGEPDLIVAILGPTASGKTRTAIDVALAIGAEIVSVDSMQVYRGMDIGTAKPTPEERRGVLHHMIDLVDPSEEFTVAQFAEAGRSII